jgi:predicted O-linked N-acetylglucosamine transferase (SPINDLY family)
MGGYLARHQRADLFLDTLPYNGVGTAYHALVAGLPVLTCAGETFAGRIAGAMLLEPGFRELVTVSLEEYERLAIRLTQEVHLLGDIRRRLAGARSNAALFNPERAVRELETAYARMWENCLRGKAPMPLAVPSKTRT